MGWVNDYSVIWRRTEGMHCSLIIREDEEVICGVEDMGKHATVDKALGIALQKGTDPGRCYLVCSGRLPVDMVAKPTGQVSRGWSAIMPYLPEE